MDPKRLLEITEDAPSPNVLVQNLLGVARSEAAPDGAKRRSRRSVDGMFASEADDPTNATAPPVATKSAVGKCAAGKAASPKHAATKTVAPPPKSIPSAERRPGGGGEPCVGWTPVGGGF